MSKANSFYGRQPTEQPQLPTRPISLGGAISSCILDTIHLEQSVETLISPQLSHHLDIPSFPTPFQYRGETQYASAVGWNSSATLRNSSSTPSSPKELRPEQQWLMGSDGELHEGLAYKEADTRGIKIRYALMVSLFT